MAKTLLVITHEESSLTLRQLLDFNANDRKPNLQRLIGFFDGVRVGARGNITVDARMGETAATATITSTGAATATETFVLNGVTFTAVASGPSANEFVVSATVATQAANIAAAINESTSAGVLNVTATSSAGVVTLTCDIPGTIGNAMTLSETLTNVTISGANFSGGASDSDVTWTA
jgi:phage tail sheath gpL-like